MRKVISYFLLFIISIISIASCSKSAMNDIKPPKEEGKEDYFYVREKKRIRLL